MESERELGDREERIKESDGVNVTKVKLARNLRIPEGGEKGVVATEGGSNIKKEGVYLALLCVHVI